MIFEPRIIFLLLWSSQIIGYLFFGDAFFPFDMTTWSIVAAAVIAFFIGGKFGSYLPMSARVLGSKEQFKNYTVRKFAYISLFLYIIVSIFAIAHLYNVLLVMTGGDLSPPAVRQAIITDFLGSREIFDVLRIFYFGVGFCIYLLAYSKSFSKKEIFLIFLIGLVSAICTTGRLYLLLFFIAVTALLYRQRIISLKIVIGAGISFVCLFFLVAIILKKGSGDVESVFGQVVWNAQVYILSSLACFNNYIQTGSQNVSDGMLIPNFIRGFFNQNFGTMWELKPDLHPFAEVPIQCNTYTVIFPLFNDGNILGVILGMFGIGVFQRYLFRLHIMSKSPVVWYFFALSLYPLIMTVFEDAYFSSPGFWLMLWVPPISHTFFNKFFRRSNQVAY